MLPDPGPRWICEEVRPKYGTIKGSSDNRADLFYRCPLLAIQSLLDRPTLLEHMDFAPRRTYQQSEDINDETEVSESDFDAEDVDTEDAGRNAPVEASASKRRRSAKKKRREKRTRNQSNKERIYTEMSTGDWWWRTQVGL
jgi:hypothetical protein